VCQQGLTLLHLHVRYTLTPATVATNAAAAAGTRRLVSRRVAGTDVGGHGSDWAGLARGLLDSRTLDGVREGGGWYSSSHHVPDHHLRSDCS